MKPFKFIHFFIVVIVLTACGGNGDTLPTAAQPASTVDLQPTKALPPTTDISTDVPPTDSDGAPGPEGSEIPSGATTGDDDFLPIDNILEEIDNEVCQSAYETKQELEVLIQEGADLAELEAAVEELIAELENCPTPTP